LGFGPIICDKRFTFCLTVYIISISTTQTESGKMKITQIKIKFLGKTGVLFRVLDAEGNVLQVCESHDEAAAWVAAQ
jgi:hypothetical protein